MSTEQGCAGQGDGGVGAMHVTPDTCKKASSSVNIQVWQQINKKVEFFVPKIAEMVYNGAQLLQRCETLWTYNFNPIRVDFHQKKNYHFFAFMMLRNTK